MAELFNLHFHSEFRLHLLRNTKAIEQTKTLESQEMSEDTILRDLQAVNDIAEQSEDRWALRSMSTSEVMQYSSISERQSLTSVFF